MSIRKKLPPKMIFFNEKNEKNMDCWQKKIDIESQNFAIFDKLEVVQNM